MWNRLRKTIVGMTVLGLTATACTMPGNKAASPEGNQTQQQNQDQNQQQNQQQSGTSQAQAAEQPQTLQAPEDGKLAIRDIGGVSYVQVNQLAQLLNFHTNYKPEQRLLQLGDNDAAYEFTVESANATKDGDPIQLKEVPKEADGLTYLPLSALSEIMSDDVQFTKQDGNVVLQAAPENTNVSMDDETPVGDDLAFGDDAEDPYKGAGDVAPAEEGEAPEEGAAGAALPIDEDGTVAAAALKNINIPAMIARGKKYLGVRYVFGADPYPQSGVFDCSTFTQYIFGKYGVSLPRTSRAQARLGNTVSRSNLRVGDLMYFYVPGRFKTNRTVGHVGIYIGDRKMLHASPEPKDGVQITNIDKPYWKRTYMFAKRLVQ